MLHGPCGVDNSQAKCMVNGKYSKHFPKDFRERTDWAKESYPLYARPDFLNAMGLDLPINMWSLTVLSMGVAFGLPA